MIPFEACSIGSAAFWAIQRRWSRGMICHRPSHVMRLGSALSVMTVSAWWWGLNVYTSVPLFPPAPTHFPAVGHPSCPPLCCFSVTIRTFSPVTVCLPPIGAVAWFPIGPSHWLSVVSWCHGGGGVGGRRPTQNVPALACQSLEGVPATISAVSSSRVSHSVLLPPNSRCCLRSLSLSPSANAQAASLLMCCSVKSTWAWWAKWSMAAANSYNDSPACWTLLLSSVWNASVRWSSL
jgi:hypothetical protein